MNLVSEADISYCQNDTHAFVEIHGIKFDLGGTNATIEKIGEENKTNFVTLDYPNPSDSKEIEAADPWIIRKATNKK